MLSTAVIIFREVLEIAMILSVVLAATRGLAGRMVWIGGGGWLRCRFGERGFGLDLGEDFLLDGRCFDHGWL